LELYSDDIDVENELIEIIIKIKTNKSKQIFKPYEIKLRDLHKNKSKEDIWSLENDTILNVKYNVYEEEDNEGIKK
jgi:hypothetical protein